MNHYFDTESAKARLLSEYKTHGKLVVGFDFDNTIFDVHNKGIDCTEIITLLQKCKKLGFVLCLYTAEIREAWLKWEVDYCRHFGIEPSYVNTSPLLGGKTAKPFFNILLDDRAGLESAYQTLKAVVDYASSQSDK